tara:strand:+ start:2704 stop:3780 length:1077 start_codon:yes stop_codon:yes gene_type:complete
MIKLLTVIGARPQFIKSATLSRIIKKKYSSEINEVVVHTGQHFDKNMSDIFFKDMNMPNPKYNLRIGGLSHSQMTAKMMQRIEEICLKEKPNWVLVFGDTNTTLAGALVAAKLNIKLAHVEAGLRSYNMNMAEEVNRVITDRISSLLFCPTTKAVKNLELEGFNNLPNTKIKNVGDIMLEGAFYFSSLSKKPAELKNIELKNYVLATIHRAETTDNIENLKSVIDALNRINKNTQVIVPIHPRTREVINKKKLSVSFRMINPVGYLEMLWLTQSCNLVITDSGGLQKEAYFFEKRCLTTRNETEWVELLINNNNILVGYESNKILLEFNTPRSFKSSGNLFGGGNTSELIITELIKTA